MLFEEDFDSYTAGDFIGDTTDWETWDLDSTVDTTVSDAHSNSPPNSLVLSDGSDVVHIFSGKSKGQLVLSGMTYVPSSTTSGSLMFITLNDYAPSGTQSWSSQIGLDASTGLVEDLGGDDGSSGTSTPGTLVFDAWVEVRLEIDLDSNEYDAFYDGALIMEASKWSPSTSPQELGAVDLYSNGASEGYFDDILLERE